MSRGIIICEDACRQEYLAELVAEFNPDQSFRFASVRQSGEAIKLSASDAAQTTVIYLSFARLGESENIQNDPSQACKDVEQLSRSFPRARTIVEFGKDWPQDAFDVLGCGAYAAVAFGTDSWDTWEVISNAIAGNNAFPPLLNADLLPPAISAENWGFMSMKFNPRDQVTNDYRFAIKPAADSLGLDLVRIDETAPPNGEFELRMRIRSEIERRSVLVAQVSSPTPNTMYEIGYADALHKPILWLRRKTRSVDSPSGDPSAQYEQPLDDVPAVLRGFIYVQYSTRTELAMRLFFGLGGTPDKLPPR